MAERNGLQLVCIEGQAGECCYLAVHTSLAGEHVNESGVVALSCAKAVEKPFKQRGAAVRQSYGLQLRVVHTGFFLGLLHYGRQLFVVAYQDEFIYGRQSLGLHTEQTNDVRLQYL